MSPPVVPYFCESDLSVGELILEQALGVVEKPADQRRLAVVDAAAGEKAEQALAFMVGKERGEGLGLVETMRHQK